MIFLIGLFNEGGCFVLNSTFESFAFVLIEAAFFMNHIITSDVGIVDELKEVCQVEIVENTTAQEIANAMHEVSRKFDEREKFQRSKMVEDRYNYNNIIKKLKGNIDKIINSCK